MTTDWIWIVSGLLLVLAEFVIPGLVVCFFGAGAILTGLALMVFPGLPAAGQLAIFLALSIALLAGVRRYLPDAFRGDEKKRAGNPDDDAVAGEIAEVVEAVSPELPGKVAFRGTEWRAKSDEALAKGEWAEVVRRENLALVVKRRA
ncbi:MAG: NfeD family protein [Kiritimatiellae bacterium]|nr:NfeD family protein [Kiritimatiellia bacterium]